MIIRIIHTALFIPVNILAICTVSFFSSFDSDSSENRATASVLEYHNSPRCNGVYVDSTLTKALAATFHVDPTFQAQTLGLPVSFWSGSRTKFNRTQQCYPKAHWIDAACVGESGNQVSLI
jgi:hypothetical protein